MDGAAMTPDEAAVVLRRAAELQAADLGHEDALDTDAVLQLGRELGLGEEAVRSALAERRRPSATSVAPVRLGLDAQVVVTRRVAAAPEAVQEHLGSWLDRQWMQRHRSHTGATTWRPRRGTVADLRRALDLLGTLELKGVGVVQVAAQREGGGTEVTVAVALDGARTEAIGLLVALPAGLVGGVAVVAGLLAGPEALLGLPLAGAAGGAGWLGARGVLVRRRRQVAEAVEGVLDGLPAD